MSGSDNDLQKKTLISSGRAMTVRFVSDSQVNDRGFLARYTFINN